MHQEQVSARNFPGNNKFKLGLFSFNTHGGLTNTLAPERWQANWPNMQNVAQQAETAGLEFLLPLAGWLSYQGDAETDGHFHETMAWAAGLLGATSDIHVFATVHVPFLHPVFAAKQAATCDHIGDGRFGLNLVAGYNIAEFNLFGVDYRSHDERYAFVEEWLTLVRRMWRENEPFDFRGNFFDLKDVFSAPSPIGPALPMVVSAGSSPTGRRFALDNADALFMVVADINSVEQDVRAIRDAMGDRPIRIYCSGHIISKSLKKESEEYYHYLIHEHGDWAAGNYLLKAYEEIKSVPLEVLQSPSFLERLMSGSGTLPVVGDPDEVVATLSRLSQAGIDGMAVALPDYIGDFALFRDEILPRLERIGLRT